MAKTLYQLPYDNTNDLIPPGLISPGLRTCTIHSADDKQTSHQQLTPLSKWRLIMDTFLNVYLLQVPVVLERVVATSIVYLCGWHYKHTRQYFLHERRRLARLENVEKLEGNSFVDQSVLGPGNKLVQFKRVEQRCIRSTVWLGICPHKLGYTAPTNRAMASQYLQV